MFSDYFLAYGQPESRSSVSLGRFKERENGCELRFRDAYAVVFDHDLGGSWILSGFHENFRVRSSTGCIDGIENQVQQCMVDTFGVNRDVLDGFSRLPSQFNLCIACGGFGDSKNILDQLYQINRLKFRFSFFAHGEHVQNEGFNSPVNFLADFPA